MIADELTKNMKQDNNNNKKIILTYSPTAFQLLTIHFYLAFVDIKNKSILPK